MDKQPAQEAYDKAIQSAREAYIKTIRPAMEAYIKAKREDSLIDATSPSIKREGYGKASKRGE